MSNPSLRETFFYPVSFRAGNDATSVTDTNAAVRISGGLTTSGRIFTGSSINAVDLNITGATNLGSVGLSGLTITGQGIPSKIVNNISATTQTSFVLQNTLNGTSGYVGLDGTGLQNFNQGALTLFVNNNKPIQLLTANAVLSNAPIIMTDLAKYAPPSFITRSIGTKIVLWGGVTASSTDYALGISSGVLWNSVPNLASSFEWYGGDVPVMTLSGANGLTLGRATNPTTGLFIRSHLDRGLKISDDGVGVSILGHDFGNSGGVYRRVQMIGNGIVFSVGAGVFQAALTISAPVPDGSQNVVTVNSVVDSSASNKGSLVVSGGAGIAKWLTIGGGGNLSGTTGFGGIAFDHQTGLGYRHFVRSRHNGVNATDVGNAIDFYLNASATGTASSAPGTGNVLGLTVAATGVTVPTINGCSFNNTLTQATNVATFYKVATLPVSSGSTFDHIRLLVSLSHNYYSNTTCKLDITFANRNGFTCFYELRGYTPVNANASLVAYNNGGLTDIYIRLTTGFLKATYTVVDAINCTVYPTVTSSGTVTGSLIFDASVPATYPPTNSIDAGGNSSFTGNMSLEKGLTLASALSAESTITRRFPPTTLTSNTTTLSGLDYGNGLYVTSASSQVGGGWEAFRGFLTTTGNPWSSAQAYNGTTGAYAGSATTTDITGVSYAGEWLQIELPYGRLLTSFTITTRQDYPASAPVTFTLLGSNDGSTWTPVHKQTTSVTWTVAQNAQTFPIVSPSVPYKWYRIVTQSNSGGNVGGVSIHAQFSIALGTVNSGLLLANTTDAVTATSGGSAQTLGGLSVGKSLHIGSAFSQASSIMNDPVAIASSVSTRPVYYHSISAPTLTSTNAGVTRATAATVYISGAPIAGTNTSIASSLALQVASGMSRFASLSAQDANVGLVRTIDRYGGDDTPLMYPPGGARILTATGVNVVTGQPYGNGTYTIQATGSAGGWPPHYAFANGSTGGAWSSGGAYGSTTGAHTGSASLTDPATAINYRGEYVDLTLSQPRFITDVTIYPFGGTQTAPATLVIWGGRSETSAPAVAYLQSTALTWTAGTPKTFTLTTPGLYTRLIIQGTSVGPNGQPYVQFNFTFTATTPYTSMGGTGDVILPTVAGGLIVPGGVGIAKSIQVGGATGNCIGYNSNVAAYSSFNVPLTVASSATNGTVGSAATVLQLALSGVTGSTVAGAVNFNLSRYAASGSAPKTQLDINVNESSYTAGSNAISLRGDGTVIIPTPTDIGATGSGGALQLAGGASIARSLSVAGNLIHFATSDNSVFVIDASPSARLGLLKQNGFFPKIVSASGTNVIISYSNQTNLTTNVAGSSVTDVMTIGSGGVSILNTADTAFQVAGGAVLTRGVSVGTGGLTSTQVHNLGTAVNQLVTRYDGNWAMRLVQNYAAASDVYYQWYNTYGGSERLWLTVRNDTSTLSSPYVIVNSANDNALQVAGGVTVAKGILAASMSATGTVTIGSKTLGTASDTTTTGLERSRYSLNFQNYIDYSANSIGARIQAVNKQTYTASGLDRSLRQSTDLIFSTAPPNAEANSTIERLKIADTGEVTAYSSINAPSLIAGDVRAIDTIAGSDTPLVYPPTGNQIMTTSPMTFSTLPYGNGTYTASASSVVNSGWQPWQAFIDRSQPGNSWSSANRYNAAGAYTGGNTTTDSVTGTVYAGETLEIQLPRVKYVTSITVYPRFNHPTNAPATFVVMGGVPNSNVMQYRAVFVQTTAITYAEAVGQTFTLTAPGMYTNIRIVVQTIGANATGGPYAQCSFSLRASNPYVSVTNASEVVSSGTGALQVVGGIAANRGIYVGAMTGVSSSIVMGGSEKYQPSIGSTTAGIVLATGVNRTNNRQLWIGDSANFGSSPTLYALRMIFAGTDFPTIGGVTTDGLTSCQLNVNSVLNVADKLYVAGGHQPINNGGLIIGFDVWNNCKFSTVNASSAWAIIDGGGTGLLTVYNSTTSANGVIIGSTSDSTSSTTGSLAVRGGAGIAKWLTLGGGGINTGGLGFGGLAFDYQSGQGFRHFIRSRHNAVNAADAGNAIDFFLNASATGSASSAPGTSNILGLSVASTGITFPNATVTGYITAATAPTAAEHLVNKAYVDANGGATAGTGLTKTGTTLSVNSAQPGITSLGTLSALTVAGNTTVNGELYSGPNAWIRKQGNSGIYWETYAGGWNMTDTSWIRSYNDKGIYTGGQVQSGSLQVNGNAAFLSGAANTPILTLNSNGGAGNTIGIDITPWSGRTGGPSVRLLAIDDANASAYFSLRVATGSSGATATEVLSATANGVTVSREFYSGANAWIRKQGSNGIHWEDYGGGWHMSDTTWMRVYNNKGIYTGGDLYVGGSATIGSLTVSGALTVRTPINATDAASKSYVDGKASTVTAGTGLTLTGTTLSVNATQTLTTLTITGDTNAGRLYTTEYVRVKGNGGFYWENWAGGFYMQDVNWIRVNNNKGIIAGTLRASNMSPVCGVWHTSDDGRDRHHYGAGGRSYYKSPSAGHEFRGGDDNWLAIIEDYGKLQTNGSGKTYYDGEGSDEGRRTGHFMHINQGTYHFWTGAGAGSPYNHFPVGVNLGRLSLAIAQPGGFTYAASVYIDGDPVLGSGVTVWNNYALYANGSVYAHIFRSANGFQQTSDEQAKDDIQDLSLGLDFINGLTPKVYKMKDVEVEVGPNGEIAQSTAAKDGSFSAKAKKGATPRSARSQKRNFGLIGQDVQRVLKKKGINDFAGIDDSSGQLTMDYSQFIAPLIKSVQELDGMRKKNKESIDFLKDLVSKQQEMLGLQQQQLDSLLARLPETST